MVEDDSESYSTNGSVPYPQQFLCNTLEEEEKFWCLPSVERVRKLLLAVEMYGEEESIRSRVFILSVFFVRAFFFLLSISKL